MHSEDVTPAGRLFRKVDHSLEEPIEKVTDLPKGRALVIRRQTENALIFFDSPPFRQIVPVGETLGHYAKAISELKTNTAMTTLIPGEKGMGTPPVYN